MKKEPVKVSFIGKASDNVYQIKFPNLQIPVNVNEELYQRMLQSSQYRFVQHAGVPQERSYANPQKMLSM